MYLAVNPTKARELAASLNDLCFEMSDVTYELHGISEKINADEHDYMSKRGFGRNLLTTAVYIDYRSMAFREIADALEWMADRVSTSENNVIRSLKTKTQE